MQRPPHFGKRATLDETLDSLLAVPMRIRCEQVILAVSPEHRKQIQLFGANLSQSPSGGASGQGQIRLVFRTLKLDCQSLLLTVHQNRVDYFQLMATGQVEVQRVETRFTARMLTIENGQMTYAGAPALDIKWDLSPPSKKK